MNISAIKSPIIKSIAFKQRDIQPKYPKLWMEKQDSFIKQQQGTIKDYNASNIDVEKLFKEYSLAELKSIFSRTYGPIKEFNEIINPIFKKLKITKPSIKIEDFQNESMRACYSFTENTISFSKQLLEEDLFLLGKKDENGKIKTSFGFCSESQIEKEKGNIAKDETNVEAIKLTDKEKEFYICSLFAHEVRHLLQAHMVASTDKCIEPFKASIRAQTDLITILKSQMKKSYNDLLSDMDKMRQEGQEITPEMEELLEECKPEDDKDYSYGLDYIPKEVLPSDSKIKFSVLFQDKRELSVKEDLLPAEISKIIEGNDVGHKALNYICNLLEIDAFNNQFEFILTNTPADNDETRKEVIWSMAIEARKNSSLGIDLLEYLNKLPDSLKKN